MPFNAKILIVFCNFATIFMVIIPQECRIRCLDEKVKYYKVAGNQCCMDTEVDESLFGCRMQNGGVPLVCLYLKAV